MKKVLTKSLLTTEIAAFCMLMLLFLLNTNKPYLLLVPLVEGAAGYFVFVMLIRKFGDNNAIKVLSLLVGVMVVLAALITLSVVGLLHL